VPDEDDDEAAVLDMALVLTRTIYEAPTQPLIIIKIMVSVSQAALHRRRKTDRPVTSC
jgi:hypothetical protein